MFKLRQYNESVDSYKFVRGGNENEISDAKITKNHDRYVCKAGIVQSYRSQQKYKSWG